MSIFGRNGERIWLETDCLTVELHGIHRDLTIGLQPFKDY